MKPEDKSVIYLVLITVALVVCLGLLSCNQYPSQKSPWAIGTQVELHDIKLPHTDPIYVKSYAFDDVDKFDGSYHWFYIIQDADGRIYTHVIDYQLRRVK